MDIYQQIYNRFNKLTDFTNTGSYLSKFPLSTSLFPLYNTINLL